MNNEISPLARAPRVALFESSNLQRAKHVKDDDNKRRSKSHKSSCCSNCSVSTSDSCDGDRNNYNGTVLAEANRRHSLSRAQSKETESSVESSRESSISSYSLSPANKTNRPSQTLHTNVNQSVLGTLLAMAESTHVVSTPTQINLSYQHQHQHHHHHQHQHNHQRQQYINNNTKDKGVVDIGLNTSSHQYTNSNHSNDNVNSVRHEATIAEEEAASTCKTEKEQTRPRVSSASLTFASSSSRSVVFEKRKTKDKEEEEEEREVSRSDRMKDNKQSYEEQYEERERLAKEQWPFTVHLTSEDVTNKASESNERWLQRVAWQQKAQDAENEAMKWHSMLINERSLKEEAISKLSTNALRAEERLHQATDQLHSVSTELCTVQSNLVKCETALEETSMSYKSTLLAKELLEQERKALLEQTTHLTSENKHFVNKCEESAKEFVKLQSENMRLAAQVKALESRRFIIQEHNTENEEKQSSHKLHEHEQLLQITENVPESLQANNIHSNSNNDVNVTELISEYKSQNELLELANTRLEAQLSTTVNELHELISENISLHESSAEITKRANKILQIVKTRIPESISDHESFANNTIATKTTAAKTKTELIINNALDVIAAYVLQKEEEEQQQEQEETQRRRRRREEEETQNKELNTKKQCQDSNSMLSEKAVKLIEQERYNALEEENQQLHLELGTMQETLNELQAKLTSQSEEHSDVYYFLHKQNEMVCKALRDGKRVVYGNLCSSANLINSNNNYCYNIKNGHHDKESNNITTIDASANINSYNNNYNNKSIAKTNYYNMCTILSILRELKQQVKESKQKELKLNAEWIKKHEMEVTKTNESITSLSHELALSRDIVQRLTIENTKLHSQETELSNEFENRLHLKEVELSDVNTKLATLQAQMTTLLLENVNLKQQTETQDRKIVNLQERETQLGKQVEEMLLKNKSDKENITNHNEELQSMEIEEQQNMEKNIEKALLEAVQCILLLQHKLNTFLMHKRLMERIATCKESELYTFYSYVDALDNTIQHNYSNRSNNDNNSYKTIDKNKKHYIQIAVHVIRAIARMQKLNAEKRSYMLSNNVCDRNEKSVQLTTLYKEFMPFLRHLVQHAEIGLPELILSTQETQRVLQNKSTINISRCSTDECNLPWSHLMNAVERMTVTNMSALQKTKQLDNVERYNLQCISTKNKECTSRFLLSLKKLDEYITQLRSSLASITEKCHMSEEDMCELLEQNNTLSTMLCCVENERNTLQQEIESCRKELADKEKMELELNTLREQNKESNTTLENERNVRRVLEERVNELRKVEINLLLQVEEQKNVIRILQSRLQLEEMMMLQQQQQQQQPPLQLKEPYQTSNIIAKTLITDIIKHNSTSNNYTTSNSCNEEKYALRKNDLLVTPKFQLRANKPHKESKSNSELEADKYTQILSTTPPSILKSTSAYTPISSSQRAKWHETLPPLISDDREDVEYEYQINDTKLENETNKHETPPKKKVHSDITLIQLKLDVLDCSK